MSSDPWQPIPGWPASPGTAAWPTSPSSPEADPAAQLAGGGGSSSPVAGPGDEFLAAIGYAGVPFLGPCVPLFVFLLGRKSDYVRRHGAQALNLSITVLLYGICALIFAAMLALDSITVALVVAAPLAAALWLATLGYVIAATASARQGRFRRVPGWLCAPIVR